MVLDPIRDILEVQEALIACPPISQTMADDGWWVNALLSKYQFLVFLRVSLKAI